LQRLANTTNISFHGIESEALLILLDQEGICASSGSACLADSDEPSHVVRAMKPETAASRHMIRFSLGVENTVAHIKTTVAVLQRAAAQLRACASDGQEADIARERSHEHRAGD
jgi:cysteine desulfurase